MMKRQMLSVILSTLILIANPLFAMDLHQSQEDDPGTQSIPKLQKTKQRLEETDPIQLSMSFKITIAQLKDYKEQKIFKLGEKFYGLFNTCNGSVYNGEDYLDHIDDDAKVCFKPQTNKSHGTYFFAEVPVVLGVYPQVTDIDDEQYKILITTAGRSGWLFVNEFLIKPLSTPDNLTTPVSAPRFNKRISLLINHLVTETC